MSTKYENILETIGRTPVVRLNKLAPDGINMYVKIESFNPMGSVKDRLALNVIEQAEKSGELQPGQTVVEANALRPPSRLLGPVGLVSVLKNVKHPFAAYRLRGLVIIDTTV